MGEKILALRSPAHRRTRLATRGKIIVASLIIRSLSTAFAQVSAADSVKFSRQLVQLEQQFMDDISDGKTSDYEKYMHPDCFVVTEDGSMVDKQKFIADIHPLPKGYSGFIKVT